MINYRTRTANVEEVPGKIYIKEKTRKPLQGILNILQATEKCLRCMDM